MNGAFFVLAITIALTSVKAVAFFAVARLDRANRTAVWFAAAFAFAALSSAGELALVFSVAVPVTRMIIAVSILATLVLVAHGLAARYGVELALSGSMAIIAAASVLFFLILDLPREDVVRQVLYQLPYALASLLSAWVIARVHTKRAVEWVMIALFVALAVQFMSKPLIAEMTGGVGAEPGTYIFTQYAAISQTMGAILLLALAAGATALVARDSAGALIARTERDTVTGLFTQNAFETHAGRMVRAASGQIHPDMGLILIAGHGNLGPADIEKAARAIGDAIALKSGPDALLGRMGPLEFAMLVPDHNLFAARRAAEAIRTAIGADQGLRLSMGITERETSDSLADMLARALWALEEARQAGGNCVRLSVRAGLGVVRQG